MHVSDDDSDNEEDLIDSIKKHFEGISKTHKVYLENNIPPKKISAFSKNFNQEYFINGRVIVYYDNTIFGKGDEGYAIVEYSGHFYLFNGWVNRFCYSLSADGVNEQIIGMHYDKSLIIKSVNIEGKESNIEWFFKGPVISALYKAYVENFTNNFDSIEITEASIDADADADISPIKPKDSAGIR